MASMLTALQGLLLSCLFGVGQAGPTFALGACYGHFTFLSFLDYANKIALETGYFDDILKTKDFNVTIRSIDTKCTASVASQKSMQFFLGQGTAAGRIYSSVDAPPVIAINGCTCSDASMAVGTQANPFKIPMISGSSTNPKLSNKQTFPFFSRTIPPDSMQGGGLARLALHFQWKRLFGIYRSGENFGEGLVSAFCNGVQKKDAQATCATVQLPYLQIGKPKEFVEKWPAAKQMLTDMANLRPSPRIILYVTADADWLSWALAQVGLVTPKHQLLGSEAACSMQGLSKIKIEVEKIAAADSDPLWQTPEWFDPVSLNKGMSCLLPKSVGPKYKSQKFLDFWKTLSKDKLKAAGLGGPPDEEAITKSWTDPTDTSKLPTEDGAGGWLDKTTLIPPYFQMHFDGMTTILVAISNMLAAGKSPDEIKGDALLAEIRGIKFEGISGQIGFDENGDRLAPYAIMNVQASRRLSSGGDDSRRLSTLGLVDVGTFDGTSDTVTFTKPFKFADGSTTTPLDRPAACPKGQEYVASAKSCVDCPMGRYNPKVDGQCGDCPSGTYGAGTGAQSIAGCTACPAGKFTGNLTGQSAVASCANCPAGRALKSPLGNTECSKCEPGFHAPSQGTPACLRCPVGKYADGMESLACKDCTGVLKDSTTFFQAATQKSDCVCKVGTFDGTIIHNKAECYTCLEGLECAESNMKLPKVAPGYYVKDNNPSEVYLCEPPEACVGSDWGKRTATGEAFCRAPRSGFMCMDCPDGQVRNENFEQSALGCKECSAFTSAIVALLPIGAFVCCSIIMYFTHESPLTESPLTMEVQNTIGQLVMFFQVTNAIFATRMLYGEPMDGFMDRLVSHLDPDAVFSNAACLSPGFVGPVMNYMVVIICPVFFMFVLLCEFLIAKVVLPGKKVFSLEALLNIWGEVLVEFYVAITLAIFAPFQCFEHPNAQSSVLSYPQVICGESDWTSMVGLAVFGIIAYPITAMIVAVFMTWQHPRAMLKNDLKHLVKGRFLFDRWTPSCYWFCNVSLIRNFFIAVLPCVMPHDSLDATILLMTIVLLWALTMLVWFKPRRTISQQRLDTFVSLVQVTVLSFGVTSAHGQPLRRGLSTACVIFICGVVVTVLSIFAFRVFQLLKQTVSYSIYLSHHSGVGGTSCRMLEQILMKSISGRIFYDIDHIGFLNDVFDAVRLSDNVLLAFGSETFCRLWCVAAIVCAYRRGTPLHRVLFVNPRPEDTVASDSGSGGVAKTLSGKFADKTRQAAFEIDTYMLRGYGLNQEDVHPAIQALTSVDATLLSFKDYKRLSENLGTMLGEMQTGRGFTSPEKVVEELFRAYNKASEYTGGQVLRQGSSLVLIDHLDGEAVAVSRLIASVFSERGDWIEDQDLPAADYANVVRSGKPLNAVFVFSQNTLSSNAQLARMGLLYKTHTEMHIVPVAVGTTFEFPDQDYLVQLEVRSLLNLGSDPEAKLTSLAGSKVSLRDVANGLSHVMSFNILFVNVPALPWSQLPKVLNDLLTRATGSGRRLSFQKDATNVPASTPAGGGGAFGGGGGGSENNPAVVDGATNNQVATIEQIEYTEV